MNERDPIVRESQVLPNLLRNNLDLARVWLKKALTKVKGEQKRSKRAKKELKKAKKKVKKSENALRAAKKKAKKLKEAGQEVPEDLITAAEELVKQATQQQAVAKANLQAPAPAQPAPPQGQSEATAAVAVAASNDAVDDVVREQEQQPPSDATAVADAAIAQELAKLEKSGDTPLKQIIPKETKRKPRGKKAAGEDESSAAKASPPAGQPADDQASPPVAADAAAATATPASGGGKSTDKKKPHEKKKDQAVTLTPAISSFFKQAASATGASPDGTNKKLDGLLQQSEDPHYIKDLLFQPFVESDRHVPEKLRLWAHQRPTVSKAVEQAPDSAAGMDESSVRVIDEKPGDVECTGMSQVASQQHATDDKKHQRRGLRDLLNKNDFDARATGAPKGFDAEMLCVGWFSENYTKAEPRPAFLGTWNVMKKEETMALGRPDPVRSSVSQNASADAEPPGLERAVPPDYQLRQFDGIDYDNDSGEEWDDETIGDVDDVKDDDTDSRDESTDSDLGSFLADEDDPDFAMEDDRQEHLMHAEEIRAINSTRRKREEKLVPYIDFGGVGPERDHVRVATSALIHQVEPSSKKEKKDSQAVGEESAAAQKGLYETMQASFARAMEEILIEANLKEAPDKKKSKNSTRKKEGEGSASPTAVKPEAPNEGGGDSPVVPKADDANSLSPSPGGAEKEKKPRKPRKKKEHVVPVPDAVVAAAAASASATADSASVDADEIPLVQQLQQQAAASNKKEKKKKPQQQGEEGHDSTAEPKKKRSKAEKMHELQQQMMTQMMMQKTSPKKEPETMEEPHPPLEQERGSAAPPTPPAAENSRPRSESEARLDALLAKQQGNAAVVSSTTEGV